MGLMHRQNKVGIAIASILASVTVSTAFAQAELEQVVVTGTRVADRSVTDTAVPVDIITSDALQNAGVTEINQALSVA